jgi:hypothetical protein
MGTGDSTQALEKPGRRIPRTRTVGVRVTEPEHLALEAEAWKAEKTVADWERVVALNRVENLLTIQSAAGDQISYDVKRLTGHDCRARSNLRLTTTVRLGHARRTAHLGHMLAASCSRVTSLGPESCMRREAQQPNPSPETPARWRRNVTRWEFRSTVLGRE